MSVQHLEVIATRNVTLRDIAAAAAAFGFPLLHYAGRINCGVHHGDACIRDDVTFGFAGGQSQGVSFALDPGTGEFAGSPDTVVFDLEDCEMIEERRITATCRNPSPFTAEQLDELLGAITSAFDARPSVIVNRASLKTGPPHPQTTDTPQDVDDYWGFDVAAAMNKYTIPNPDDDEERLFECWRCAKFCISGDFPGSFGEYDDGYDGVNRVASVLGRMVIGGEMSACQWCVADATVRPAMMG